MQPIARAARAQTLLTAAESMAQAAEPYQTVFLQSGRPSDFVVALLASSHTFPGLSS